MYTFFSLLVVFSLCVEISYFIQVYSEFSSNVNINYEDLSLHWQYGVYGSPVKLINDSHF